MSLEMTKREKNLLDLLKDLNYFERRCQYLDTDGGPAIPPEVYADLKSLRDKIAKWGTDAVDEEKRSGDNQIGASSR